MYSRYNPESFKIALVNRFGFATVHTLQKLTGTAGCGNQVSAFFVSSPDSQVTPKESRCYVTCDS
jgi:hypothetical protein